MPVFGWVSLVGIPVFGLGLPCRYSCIRLASPYRYAGIWSGSPLLVGGYLVWFSLIGMPVSCFKAKEAVCKGIREMTGDAFTELQICPNGMYWLVDGLMIDGKEADVGRCMRGCDGRLCFI